MNNEKTFGMWDVGFDEACVSDIKTMEETNLYVEWNEWPQEIYEASLVVA